MSVKVQDKGQYEIFETNHGHEILVLKGQRGTKWLALVRGQKGDILVRTDSGHVKERTIRRVEPPLLASRRRRNSGGP